MTLARNNRIGNSPALAVEGVESVRNEPKVGRTVIEASIGLKLHFPPRLNSATDIHKLMRRCKCCEFHTALELCSETYHLMHVKMVWVVGIVVPLQCFH